MRPSLLFAAVALAGATAALAASGVLVGTPVKPNAHLSRGAGEGVPAPGESRLLPLRVADPAGGPPWGLRVVHTTRGYICLQVARVQDGELGVLGIDGAFGDDGLFHPLPTDALPDPFEESLGNVLVDGDAFCSLPGETYSALEFGVDRNAGGSLRQLPPAAHQRAVAFGLLGPHAVSVSYRSGRGERTAAVLAGSGAFLLVVRHPRPAQRGVGFMASDGAGTRGSDRPGPNGILTAITYRFGGRLCSDGAAVSTAPCPRAVTPPQPRTLVLHEPLHVALRIRRRLIYGATLRFKAPYAVSAGSEDYAIQLASPDGRHRAGIELGELVELGELDRNVRRGASVSVRLSYLFANSDDRTVSVTVVYQRREGLAVPELHSTQIGTLTIREPPGMRSATPPHPRH